MITSKNLFQQFIKADVIVRFSKVLSFNEKIKFFFIDHLYRFMIFLRTYELYRNKQRNVFESIFYFLIKIYFRQISIRLSFSIPPNVCGQGLYLPHYGTIVINSKSKIGTNCLIHPGVVIGANNGTWDSPQIGNNVFIGPGAKIFGQISIADGVYIGANAVVTKSILEPNAVVIGIPAKIVRFDNVPWWKKNRIPIEN